MQEIFDTELLVHVNISLQRIWVRKEQQKEKRESKKKGRNNESKDWSGKEKKKRKE